jgi:hypothetical protein
LYFENAIFIVISEGKASSKNASKATLQFQWCKWKNNDDVEKLHKFWPIAWGSFDQLLVAQSETILWLEVTDPGALIPHFSMEKAFFKFTWMWRIEFPYGSGE